MRQVLSSLMFILLVVLYGPVQAGLYDTSFDTPDAVDSWLVVSGEWVLDADAGQYTVITSSATAISVYEGGLVGGGSPYDLSDYTVTTEVGVNGGNATLVARFSDDSNYYMFRYHSGQQLLQIYRFGGEGTLQVGNTPVNPDLVPEVYTLTFTVKGLTKTVDKVVRAVSRSLGRTLKIKDSS